MSARIRVSLAALGSSAVVAGALAARLVSAQGATTWTMVGNDPMNSRFQPAEHALSVSNVARLAPKWTATLAGDISGTPAVADGALYIGDWGGTLWKLDAKTGKPIWSHSVPDYTGIAGDYARTSPVLVGNTLIVADIRHPDVLGIDIGTGQLKWKTQVHPDDRGVMTGSPVLADGTLYIGVSTQGSGGSNATFRGAIVALDPTTGRVVWQRYSLPDNGGAPGGYAGATMFAAPTVSAPAGLVYGTFGQPYVEPASVTACHTSHGGFTDSCEPADAYFRSIVAFDVKTGEPKWSYRPQSHDSWQRACGSQPASVTWCAAQTDTEKWDFGGSSPNLFRITTNGASRDVVGVGEKSGVYLVLDAKTGQFVWNTLLGPGGDQGGMEWGTSYDGTRIYAAITNQHHISYKLTENGKLTDTTTTGGSWAAMDPATGTILWQTADPQTEALASGPVGVWDLAPVMVANGVVYAASMARAVDAHQMFALDAATGKILWQFGAGSSVNASPAIVDGTLYWGSGYSRSAEGSGNNKLYAFSIDGR